jgi:hypothetical protein
MNTFTLCYLIKGRERITNACLKYQADSLPPNWSMRLYIDPSTVIDTPDIATVIDYPQVGALGRSFDFMVRDAAAHAGTDYIVTMGQDNVLSDQGIELLEHAAAAGKQFVGFNKYGAVSSEGAVSIYSAAPFGAGRAVRSDLYLRAADYHGWVYPHITERGLDGAASQRIYSATGVYPQTINTDYPMVFDFKSDDNLHSWEEISRHPRSSKIWLLPEIAELQREIYGGHGL